MRSEAEIKDLVINFAKHDDRIRAVLLNGSRANPNTPSDNLQDFDVAFIVNNLESFLTYHNWVHFLGDKIITQLPNEMTFGKNNDKEEPLSFAYLMLFKDESRIDLTLLSKQNLKPDFKLDSLTMVWLDKDNLFSHVSSPSDKDYHICKPTEKEFLDTCNEFWWVSTYIAKGLLRTEITYAKEMSEIIVRPVLMKIIEWKIGVENSFSVSFGKAGRFIRNYVTDDFYEKILQTYSGSDIEENWKSLFIMTDVFKQASNEIAQQLGFQIAKKEQDDTLEYLQKQYNEQKNYR